jgi:RimJ/RimL family protein N-acetyltransferase
MQNPKSLAVTIPLLETERLLLRGHGMEDFTGSAAMWADPKVTRYIMERPLTEEECWTRFLRYAGHWAVMGFGYWVVVNKHDGEFIGEAGFADYKRAIQPSLDGMPEAGWVFASQTHGKGYATEAVSAITAWGDVHFKTATACIIAPENAASVRVAMKCGYREAQRTAYHGHATVMYFREPGNSRGSE